MKKLIPVTLSFVLLTFFSCNNATEPAETKYNWEKIELTNETTVYSFYGSLDNYLLIGTFRRYIEIR